LTLRKKEKKLEFWPRLSKVEQKSALIKKDFSAWVEEDEQDVPEDPDFGMGSAMMDCGGMDYEKVGFIFLGAGRSSKPFCR
jgi:hypothetical protein